ncbi:ParA family partition ATPase [Methylobacterium sp. 285MFTsu5.1]|uniref:ParA family partition ATPase n=1 Tax=Methylobacterium sp. 285MFTsu5.1 TaxID=1172187 RepID=UPI000381CBD7|nr:ParA family partition ATPase [Methylobacterium sp. 285MFTsu5.1]
MKTIAVISQKGGSGKTTIALHLAVAATEAGLATAVVDLDPQASATKWGDTREQPPDVVSAQAERLQEMLDAARDNGADLVVVDTAPNADRASLLAMRAADLILIPCRPARFDLEAIAATLELSEIARKEPFVVLSCAPVRSALVGEASSDLEGRGARIAPVVIHQRVAYSHAVIDGRTATEFEPEGKAAEEAWDLLMWACGRVGLSARRPVGTVGGDDE